MTHFGTLATKRIAADLVLQRFTDALQAVLQLRNASNLTTAVTPPNEHLTHIGLQAADWLLRFEAREISCAEHVRYLEWLRRSPFHLEEMQRVLRFRAALSKPELWASFRNADVSNLQAPCHHRPGGSCRAPMRRL